MRNANDAYININDIRLNGLEAKYRCKSCKKPVVMETRFGALKNTFTCRTPGCERNNGSAESALFGLPDWVEEYIDATK